MPATNNQAGLERTRSSPGSDGYALTSAMLHDINELAVAAKAMSAYNATASDVIIAFVPAGGTATLKEAIPAGQVRIIPWSAKQVKVTGSTGLGAGLDAGTVIVNMVTL